jgi:folate-dependent phosphoribosylglycinamide formyltransferase PurN
MSDNAPGSRIVVFTGGAVLEDACLEFIRRIDERPELDLVGVFCEAAATGVAGVIRDLWTRRGPLAPLLLAQRVLRRVARCLAAPRAELARRRTLRRLGTRLHFVADIHAPSVLSRVAALKPDLGAVYGGPILQPALFRIPAQGTLGIHHGRLPDYRGKKTTFWAMHNGERSVGVAIQRIGAGLDRGDVLRDATVPVGRMPLPIVSRRLERRGLDLYVEALLSVHRGTAVCRPQPAGGGPLYKDPRAADIVRFWMRYFARLFGHSAPSRSSGA